MTTRRELRERRAQSTTRILVVCTGNVARSVLVERILRSALERSRAGDVVVHSAGTHALTGARAAAEAERAAAPLGIDVGRHTARQLDPGLVREAALVLAASREHKAAVLALHPPALARTFTVREAARIADGLSTALAGKRASGPERLATVSSRVEGFVDRARRARSQYSAADPADDDIVDPYRRGPEIERLFADQTIAATRVLLTALGID